MNEMSTSLASSVSSFFNGFQCIDYNLDIKFKFTQTKVFVHGKDEATEITECDSGSRSGWFREVG